MRHSFDTELAKKYGIAGSLMLGYIYYWVQYNQSKCKNFLNGKYWMYLPVKGFAEHFDYMTIDVIRRTKEKLVSKGALITTFSKSRDRTMWYTLAPEIIEHLSKYPTNWQNSQMQLADLPNANGEIAKCNTVIINTISNNNPPIYPPKTSKRKKAAPTPIVQFAEFVAMTNAEYEALIAKLGSKSAADKCIELLDNYKGSSGKKYRSDYRAILSWVIDKYKQQHRSVAKNDIALAAAQAEALLGGEQDGKKDSSEDSEPDVWGVWGSK